MVLTLDDVGKEISPVYLRTGSDARGNWAESRFARGEELINARLGPQKIVSRVYTANNLADAQAIYSVEVDRQTRMPEAEDDVGGTYRPQDIGQFGDAQSSLAACNDNCNTADFERLHQRTVMRYQNVVAVVYFWGRGDQASSVQMNEWLSVIRNRLN